MRRPSIESKQHVKTKRLQIAILLLCLHVAGVVGASPRSKCNRIRNLDTRYLCLARVTGDASKCNSIRDRDDRFLCLAEIKNDKSKCRSIRSRDKRNMCLARVR